MAVIILQLKVRVISDGNDAEYTGKIGPERINGRKMWASRDLKYASHVNIYQVFRTVTLFYKYVFTLLYIVTLQDYLMYSHAIL